MWSRAVRVFGVALTLTVAGCASSSSPSSSKSTAKPRVVASTNVYGDIVRAIAGDLVKTTSIISNPDADPHSYEADTKNQLELSKADIVIENGGGYDDFVDSMLKGSNNSDATVLNVVDISGFTAPKDGELNEHVWYDFGTVGKFVSRLVDALSTTDPDHAATFRTNAERFRKSLDALVAREAEIKQAHAGAGAAITEPVPLYMLEACGLVNKTPEEFSAAIEEGNGIPAAVLADTLALFSDKAVAVLAYNAQTAGPETEKVLTAAKDHDIAVVPVTETLPKGKTYLAWMSDNLSAIEHALG